MIKSMLVGTLLVVGLGAGVSIAQERTISVWGHDFTVQDTSPAQPAVVALAPDDLRDQMVRAHRARHTR